MIQRPRVQLQCIAMEWGVLQPPGVLQQSCIQQRSVRNQPALESFPILRKNPLHKNRTCNSALFVSQSIEICLFSYSNVEILLPPIILLQLAELSFWNTVWGEDGFYNLNTFF